MGDFNEDIGQEADGMISVMQSVGLIDIMRQQHPLHLPATYARGQKCLDYVLGTAAVAAAVRKAGYEPFNARYTTDHRPYFVDFSVTELFGHPTQPLSKLEPRVLKSNNLHQVTAYVRKKYDLLERHNVFRRIDRLLLLGDRHSFAERLDKDVVEASLAAEKSLRKYGEPQWSVELHHERKKVQILKKCLSMAKTRLDNAQTIRQEWRKIYGNTDPPGNERECLQHLRQSETRVKELVNASFDQREHERLKRIQELSKSNKESDKSRAKMLRQLQVAEAKNRLYAKIRAMRTVKERTGVSRIEIPLHPDQDPKVCSEWQQIDVPTEVLEHLRLRNQKHFGQAAGTPFTIPPLSTHLGYCGDGPFATHILEGKYPYLAGFEENLKLLVQHLKITDELAHLRVFPTIDENEYVAKLKVWRESTVTSPSRMHLGHYKAMIARHLYFLKFLKMRVKNANVCEKNWILSKVKFDGFI
jgi:hypothetical protein